ncbi:MAG: glucose-6-phosphate isomerase [Spirochaetes bacterium]|nr:glucose-6-phosphate isomerase [Spirochaetota bacterium]
MLKKSILYDYNNVLADKLDSPISITLEEIESYKDKAIEIHKTLTARRKKGELPFYNLPYQKQELDRIKKLGDTITKEMGERFENLLVIGIGGSSLGGIALIKALTHPFYNLLPNADRKTPRVFYAENIDADEIKGLFDILDPEKTVVNIISKSGTTAEPMANFLLFQKYMTEKIGEENFKKQVVATTDPKKGTMRQIVTDFGFRTLNIPEGVGGRFSVLTPVGLFPGYLAGIDLDALLEGAAFMDELTKTDDLLKNPAYINAVIHYHLHVHRGVNNAVLMPYSVALSLISDWYRQLLAESLGKKWALTGEVVYAGQTPIKAVGAIDQHSQVQLYREGPFDKIFTILSVENLNNFLNLPSLYEKYEGLSYLGGHTINELFNAEKKATILALTKSGRPSIEITLPEINPHTIGQVFYLYEVQTVFAGYLYNINSLDQPGVEAGKQYTYGMLGRKGFEDMKKEADSFPAKDEKFIIKG